MEEIDLRHGFKQEEGPQIYYGGLIHMKQEEVLIAENGAVDSSHYTEHID